MFNDVHQASPQRGGAWEHMYQASPQRGGAWEHMYQASPQRGGAWERGCNVPRCDTPSPVSQYVCKDNKITYLSEQIQCW